MGKWMRANSSLNNIVIIIRFDNYCLTHEWRESFHVACDFIVNIFLSEVKLKIKLDKFPSTEERHTNPNFHQNEWTCGRGNLRLKKKENYLFRAPFGATFCFGCISYPKKLLLCVFTTFPNSLLHTCLFRVDTCVPTKSTFLVSATLCVTEKILFSLPPFQRRPNVPDKKYYEWVEK